ncbi:hypothetical protein [Terasakiella sp.]|uniref:hypothetical protein n=1 Tax=Terasakiella sp. TaxID=2034861 RepID=UPI003AA89EEB
MKNSAEFKLGSTLDNLQNDLISLRAAYYEDEDKPISCDSNCPALTKDSVGHFIFTNFADNTVKGIDYLRNISNEIKIGNSNSIAEQNEAIKRLQNDVAETSNALEALTNFSDELKKIGSMGAHWEDREKSANFAFLGFILGTIAISLSIITLISPKLSNLETIANFIENLSKVDTAANLSKLGAIVNWTSLIPNILPTLLFIWLLRILIQQAYKYRDISIDAAERKTMVKTYLSLVADKNNALSPEERDLILKPLFTLSSHPRSYDDGAPIQIIEKIVERVKK